jgi:spore germination protein YaaH
MKKVIAVLLGAVVLLGSTVSGAAYMVNPFYAIDSASEYGKIKEYIYGGDQNVYFQWGRLARNKEGKIQFTDKMAFGISQYDNRSEYGIPYKAGSGSDTEYIVQPGDSLSLIAGKFEIPYKLLGEYNGIADLSIIQAGQKLKIPTLELDTGSKDDYKQRYPNGKALFSIFFDAVEYSDKKNSAVEFLNMDEKLWKENIINPIIDRVDSLGFDGVVLDFEGFRDSFSGTYYTTGQRTGLREKYNKFLTCMKELLGDKELEVVVHPQNVAGYFDGYDMSAIGKIADKLILMAYDFQSFQKYGANEGVPAELVGKIKSIERTALNQPCSAPYAEVEGAVKKLLQSGTNPEKILLGISLVGMEFIKYKKTSNGKSYIYYVLNRPDLETIEAVRAEEQYMENPAEAKKVLKAQDIPGARKQELEKKGDEVLEIEYRYESPKSLYMKYYKIVNSNGLSGVTVWRIGKGSERAWKSLNDMFASGKYGETPSPAVTPTVSPSESPAPTPSASGANKKIVLRIGDAFMDINGDRKEIDPGRGTVPVIKNNRTLVPIRTIIEALGGQVQWEAPKNLVTIQYDSTKIELTINSRKIVVNGSVKDNDVAPEIINGRTFLPLRFLLENLGFGVDWNPDEKVVTIEN